MKRFIIGFALATALSGTAMAASHYIITSTKQISPSVLHELRGTAGPQGAAGEQGPAGPAGNSLNPDGDYSSSSGANVDTSTPTADVIVRCAPGDHVLSGGFMSNGVEVTTSTLIAAMGISSGNYTGRGWEVKAHLDASSSTGNVTATVTCSRSR